MRRRLTSSIVALELFALFLVLLELPGGVRTDEAKYLLSIPYPHPPILRSLFSSFGSWPMQDVFVRLVIATLVVQSVWLLLDLASVLPRERRIALVSGWLLSAAVILQGGTIVLSVAAALFGLVCVWLTNQQHELPRRILPVIALLWLVALFSVYQSLLYLPLVFAAMWKTKSSPRTILLYLVVPVLLLGLYSAAHPLVLASILNVTTQDAPLPLLARSSSALWTLVLAGGALSVVGLWGILVSGQKSLQISTILVLAFIVLSAQHYYAILLTPLLLAGLFDLLCRRRVQPRYFVTFQLFSAVILIALAFPDVHPGPAKATIDFLTARNVTGPILIDGPFGHDWQYWSHSPVLRFTQQLSTDIEESAAAFVCTKATCEEDVDSDQWERLEGSLLRTWVRKKI